MARHVCPARHEAILAATAKVVQARGQRASMDEIAREAGVSKQTIYNRFGSKDELVRALTSRRLGGLAGALEVPGSLEDPQVALAAFAKILLAACLGADDIAISRLAIIHSAASPDVASAVYDAGPRATWRALAAFLAAADANGRLSCPDPAQAAEFFAGMVVGLRQIDRLLGKPFDLLDPEIETIAGEAAARFVRAYARC